MFAWAQVYTAIGQKVFQSQINSLKVTFFSVSKRKVKLKSTRFTTFLSWHEWLVTWNIQAWARSHAEGNWEVLNTATMAGAWLAFLKVGQPDVFSVSAASWQQCASSCYYRSQQPLGTAPLPSLGGRPPAENHYNGSLVRWMFETARLKPQRSSPSSKVLSRALGVFKEEKNTTIYWTNNQLSAVKTNWKKQRAILYRKLFLFVACLL